MLTQQPFQYLWSAYRGKKGALAPVMVSQWGVGGHIKPQGKSTPTKKGNFAPSKWTNDQNRKHFPFDVDKFPKKARIFPTKSAIIFWLTMTKARAGPSVRTSAVGCPN